MIKLNFIIGLGVGLLLPLFGGEIPNVLPIGSAAPDFSMPGIDGKTHTLSEYAAAKVFCVIFT